MRAFAKLSVAAATIAGAAAQYWDGYENVTTSTAPVQIRVAYAGPSAMMVSWNTFSQLTNPSVQWGTNPNALTNTAVSTVSITYPTSLTYNNHVNITGLAPFTTYYYLPQYSNATTPYSFTTSRAAGDMTPFNVAVVVDMGTFGSLGLSTTVGTGAANPLRPGEQTTISALSEMTNNYDFLIHAGDIAYADYWLKEEIQNYLPNTTIAQGAAVYEHILNAFFDEMEPLTSEKAYMVNPGNHEANCDNGGTTNKATGQKYTEAICMVGQTNFTGYINRWRMPSGPSGGLGNMWYSYNYGMVHFVHIDTETDLGNGLVGPDEGSPEYAGPFGTYNQQINWLTSDLASVNRTLTPWIVVFGHRGWYLSVSGSVCANCQTAFETLLYTYNVDLYINGHAHVYERVQPIYKGTIDPNGLNNPRAPLYLTNGAAGHYDGLDTFTATQPYSVYRENSDYAWTMIEFVNSTTLILNSMWSANNSIFDSATLYKAHVFSSNSSTTTTTTMTSTSTSSSSTSTSPTTTTNTATTTTSSVSPSYTNFNGQGHLYVYSGGMIEGDIGSAGTWYNTPGQNTATYTAVPVNNNGSSFYLQHSTSYCTINTDFSFGCLATSASGATLFGQTPDGNLTYNGNEAFYASSAASASSRPTVYASSLPVSLNIVWGTAATTTVSTTTTSSSTSSPTSTSTTSTSTSTSSSTTSTSTSSSTTTSSSSTSATSGSSVSTISVTISTTVTYTQPASTVTQSTTTTQSTTLTSVQSTTITQPTTLTTTQPTTITSVSTETDSTTATQTTTETDSTTITQSTTSTETDSTTITQSTTSTETDSTTITQSTTETDSTTISLSFTTTATVSTTETDTITTTQPASTMTTTTTSVQPASTITVTQPASTTTVTQPASTMTITSISTSTTTYTQPASTTTVTQPASTTTVTQPASTTTITQPASTTTVTQPASTSTITKTATSTSTVTVTAHPTTTKVQTTITTVKTTTTTVKTKGVTTVTKTATVTQAVVMD